MTTPTLEDIPQILSSISWQLKRIADSLESNKEPIPVNSFKEDSPAAKKLKEMLAAINQK